MLRHVVMQMSVQSYPLDFVIYLNSDQYPAADRNYTELLSDIIISPHNKLLTTYGPSLDLHKNQLKAINLVDIEDYDLFLKIDDDDIYRINYVADLVRDYEKNLWDFAGEHSCGMLNGAKWKSDQTLKNMGLVDDEKCAGMPPSWAFSRKAMNVITKLESHPRWFEDRHWKFQLAKRDDIKSSHRKDTGNFHYNVHGANISTSTWLEDDASEKTKKIEATSQEQGLVKPHELKPVDAFKLAISLLISSVPKLLRLLVGRVLRKFTG
jgi:hypothetical protein